MTTFEPGQVGNPDWQRVSQFTGAFLLNQDSQVVPTGTDFIYPLMYVGDVPSIGVIVDVTNPETGWFVAFRWRDETPAHNLLDTQTYAGLTNPTSGPVATVFDIIGNGGPFLDIRLVAEAGPPGFDAFDTTVWKTNSYPGTSIPVDNPISLREHAIVVAPGAPQTFYSALVTRESNRYLFRGAGGADSLIELGTVDGLGLEYPAAQTDIIDPYGNAYGQDVLSLGTYQPYVRMTNRGAVNRVMDATLVLV